ncbi:MAG TPA: multidrug effflux MFS transporter [Casimicrobiaceae bacterium]|jgi:DHA1 family bicyclomycin/chloramphenicol resistance-like MFS transporter|nr:multidrug effflux MFS transporter [Casimicrobiaceae bacterium]
MTAVHVRTWSLAILIAALAMLGPFSIDAYLPAFHAIGREFSVPPIAVQQTLSVYLFAYAFMMLWHGALADALGRRPVVLASLAIYALATLGCAIAGNIETLWLFRALQGICAGAGIVVGRAIIRDRFHGAEAQRLMSQITLVFGVAPAIAPVLGGVLLNVFGWRAIFWLLLALVIALLTWASKRLPETLPVSARQSLLPRHLWRNYVNVLRRPEFLLLGAIPALNFAAFFLYIAVAPSFLMDLLGVSSYGFAWLFIPMITGVMIGALISGRTAGMMTPRRTIGLGYILMFVGVATDIGVAALVPPGVPWHVLPIMIYAVGSSVTMPSATLLLLDLFPTMRGLASSLQGFLHFVLAAINAGTIAPMLAGSLISLALGMAGFTVLSLLLWITYLRHTR